MLARAAAAGAAGFLRKEEEFTQILRAIRSASDGEMVVEHSTLAAVLRKLHETEPPAGGRHQPGELTAREHEVLTLLGQGLDVSAIATALTVSTHTARWHVKSILSKLGARSQLEAVVRAIRERLIPPPSSESERSRPIWWGGFSLAGRSAGARRSVYF